MVRITRSGGVVAASEPDWRTFRLNSDEAAGVGSRVAAEWINSFRNPSIGGALLDLFSQHGLHIANHFVQPLLLRDFEQADRVFDIRSTVKRCIDKQIVGAEKAARLLRGMITRSAEGRFYALLCIHTVTARKR